MPGRFTYQPRTREQVAKRANQQGGVFDSWIAPDVPQWTPKEGNSLVRFCPPTWDGAEHFGFDVYVHYGIGADNQSYLCLDKMLNKPCPICEERKRAEKAGDADYAKQLAPSKRVVSWMVDRDHESEGPQIWAMSWTLDRDIAAICVDKRSGEVICLDNPEKGYDLSFERKGTGKKTTKYFGLQVDRKSSYLSQDERTEEDWLDYISKNPVPNCLVFFPYEHIADVFAGTPKDREREEEGEGRRRESTREESRRGGEERESRRSGRWSEEPDSRSERSARTEEPPRSERRRLEEREEPRQESRQESRQDTRQEPTRREGRNSDEGERGRSERSSSRSSRDEPPSTQGRRSLFRSLDDDEAGRGEPDERPRESSGRQRLQESNNNAIRDPGPPW